MKFEMKKRILALALAGTTAFSVFGGAMSANAVDTSNWWNSSHVNANDDAYYKHMTPSGNMNWSTVLQGAASDTVTGRYYYEGSQVEYNLDKRDGEIDVSKVYMAPWRTTNDATYGDAYGSMKDVVTDDDIKGFKYFKTADELAKAYGYTTLTTGNAQDGFVDTNSDGTADYVIAKRVSDGKYFVFDKEVWEATWGYNGSHDSDNWADHSGSHGLVYDNLAVEANTVFFLYGNTNSISTNASDDQGVPLTAIETIAEEVAKDYDHYMINKTNGAVTSANGPDVIISDMYMVPANSNDLIVINSGNYRNNVWADNYNNINYLVACDTFEEVMSTPVEAEGGLYLYDFDDLPLTDDDFVEAWEDGDIARELSRKENNATYGSYAPETGVYKVSDIRADVIYAWEDFLESIDAVSGSGDFDWAWWAKRTIENYAYTYYDDDIVVKVDKSNKGYDIYYVTSGYVDVYNFAELIEDIVNLAPSAKVVNAQTSELVYLMQQYYKYTEGGYVDIEPVETDEWGDLLVTLLEAPTEDDFRNASAYNRYTDTAEELIEDYNEAETSLKVELAEEAMYKLLTTVGNNSRMQANGDADTTNLGTAIDNLYFNFKWTGSFTPKEGTSYTGVYAGYVDRDGDLSKAGAQYAVDGDLGGSTEPWTPDYYALYPASDYAASGTKYVYPGVSLGASNVNESYGWFANVYELAYDIFTGNEFQGTLDAMAEALNEAVANLVPTPLYNAHASDVLGAEEASDELAPLVESDYTTAMWANRDKIYNFITERVMNDEIGETGTNNAEEIATLMDTHLGYQRNQNPVTRSDINGVSTAKANAEAVLEALENDDENYNAAQATALKNAIDECQYVIDIYNGDYSTSEYSQSVNTDYNGAVGDKDQILKSDCTNAIQAVDDAINFANVVMGWIDTDEGWKYGVNDEDGPHYLNDGWHQVDGGKTWFYFDENGVAKESTWWQDPATGTWYYFNQNCGAAVGWCKIDGDWYYFKGNNAMKTGWEKVEGSWYYMNSSGKMVTGWCQINGTWYYFSKESNALGQMLANTTTPDGYKVDANGALVE